MSETYPTPGPAGADPAEERLFEASDDGSRPRRYLLTMFPYPSGDLHMGHAEVFAITDVVARYWRAKGFDVLNPVGWDSFGLPAENAAIRRGEHPAVFTEANIATQAASIRRYGVSFDWSRRLHTHDPGYYRWTQWLFARLHERGLAYRAAAEVNWCPADRTVLANEQVVDGACERCGTSVVRRTLTQWFLRITAYADRLLDDMALLQPGWPAHVLTMQRNWIGRQDGPDGVTYRLHDWLVSRQRYWGAPVPVVHRTVHEVDGLVEAGRFNVAVARLMELVGEVRRAVSADGGTGDGPGAGVRREAVEAVAVLLGLFAPQTARTLWEGLGHRSPVAAQPWPVVDPALLVASEVEAVVQVDGKVRDRLPVPADVAAADLERVALARPAVGRAVGGRPVRRVVVRPPHLVNVVLG